MKKPSLIAALTLSSVFTAAVLVPTLASAQSSLSSSSLSSSSLQPGKPGTPKTREISDGLVVNLIGDILGPGISDHVGVMTGDLGTMTSIGEGEEFAIIFGDSWRGANFGQGEWMSPVGVVAELDAEGRIVIKRPLNEGDHVEQLVEYSHHDGLTLIPSDIINLDGTLYMQGMWNKGIGNVRSTQIWRSTDQGQTWQSVSRNSANYLGGKGQLITWEQGPDGYVYMMSTSFQRKNDVYLARFLPEDIGDHTSWEHYQLNQDGTGTWGNTATPILGEQVSAGEMSLRYIDGHWVLAMFNAETWAIEVRVSEEIQRDWNEIEPASVVVAGAGGWGAEQDAGNFTQLYGGYIVPGSTLDNLDIVVSQWNTNNNSRYMSTQFNVKGLDTFFGIESDAPAARTMMAPQPERSGNQSVIQVEETPVDPTAADQLQLEGLMEEATDLSIVPLEDGARF